MNKKQISDSEMITIEKTFCEYGATLAALVTGVSRIWISNLAKRNGWIKDDSNTINQRIANLIKKEKGIV